MKLLTLKNRSSNLKSMILQRNLTTKINWMIDNLFPPILRDSKVFMYPIFWFFFRGKAKYFMEFKENSPFMTHEEYKKYYALLADVHLKRETDLNDLSVKRILEKTEGRSVLDVGAGRGYLAFQLAKKRLKVYGLDIYFSNELKKSKLVKFVEGDVEHIPFKNKTFDTVVCTHTIEHVRHPIKLIKEMKRVAKKRIIIVTPRQREYRYTFDLHLNFFPYIYDLERLTCSKNGKFELLDNDIYYEEDLE